METTPEFEQDITTIEHTELRMRQSSTLPVQPDIADCSQCTGLCWHHMHWQIYDKETEHVIFLPSCDCQIMCQCSNYVADVM